MKKVMLLLASLFVVSCAGSMPEPVSTRRLNAYYQSTLMVRVQGTEIQEDGAIHVVGWSGTGFSIGSTNGDNTGSDLLTNHHVCAKAGNAEYTIIDYTGKRYNATFVRNAPEADLCLLHTEAIIKPARLAEQDPKFGDYLVAIGAPHGQFPNVTTGFTSGYCPVDFDGEGVEIHVVAICTSVPIYSGSSGSPAFGVDGKVYGIFFAARVDAEHMSYMIGVGEILRFLNTTNNVFYR
jgi:S1-C subfamily serine protease